MTVLDTTPSTRVTRVLDAVRNFTTGERIVLARLLLDSVAVDKTDSQEKGDVPGAANGARSRSRQDLQAFADAAGSWSDVDTDAFIHAVREQRDQSYRASVDL